MFWFFDDPEGPNLLVVMGMAAIIYLVSLAIYSLLSLIEIPRLLLTFFTQIIIATGFFFFLSF